MSFQDDNAVGPDVPSTSQPSAPADDAPSLQSRPSTPAESGIKEVNLETPPDASAGAQPAPNLDAPTIPIHPPSNSGSPEVEYEATASAPYGTRSRQRTSGQRPNYAEDKDMDVDTETNGVQPAGKAGSSRKSGTPLSKMPIEADDDSGPRRGFSAINTTPKSTSQSAASKDPIPGTSTFASSPGTTVPSKKRKQPGSSTVPALSSAQTATSRLKSAVNASRRPQPETSMMSFDHCQGYLNPNGQLKADDGTSLAVNGESNDPGTRHG